MSLRGGMQINATCVRLEKRRRFEHVKAKESMGSLKMNESSLTLTTGSLTRIRFDQEGMSLGGQHYKVSIWRQVSSMRPRQLACVCNSTQPAQGASPPAMLAPAIVAQPAQGVSPPAALALAVVVPACTTSAKTQCFHIWREDDGHCKYPKDEPQPSCSRSYPKHLHCFATHMPPRFHLRNHNVKHNMTGTGYPGTAQCRQCCGERARWQ
eukprot:363721-Chlamydomonas_euryale.AAC.4